ncbi:MAG: uroporphyrinogen-III C-methyltransferase [Betaproteobacteria bacterium]|nr:MAG: uroporphyrinogen-III C-methyltransferase [Betaproteobacteria bacterium]
MKTESKKPSGKVFLVGAGPGDIDLLTVKAARLLGQADVVLIDDLAGSAVVALCPQARIIHVGKRGGCKSTPQSFIERLLVREAKQGRHVVRLKGGDPSVFGRSGEEIAALERAGIDYEIVPGVSSGVAAAAQLGVSLTHRDHAQGVAFITAHGIEGAAVPWQALARGNLTLVVYMGVARAASLRQSLLDGGMPPQTPVIAVENVSSAESRSIVATIGSMLTEFDTAELKSPAVIVIGEAMRARAASLATRALSERDCAATSTIAARLA